ncbi:lactococcin 972 family bacteriocin [Streptomyces uncialis]|uniref:lactococcin 972 family bacteriocin n=1 Tax=Streptomyces uncialis TaxID=1048205 RepID=UPI0038267761
MTKKFARLGVVAVAAIIAGATPALAAVSYPGGGEWHSGVNSALVYSDYFHSTACHGATSVGAYTDRSPDTAGGAWAFTDAPSQSTSVDKSYWRKC